MLLITGRTFSLMGASMVGLAGMMLSYDLTHDSSVAGIVMGLGLIGMLVTTLPAGVIADRYDRKKIMIVASILQAFLLLSIPIAERLGALSIVQLAIVTFLAGAISVFYIPAEQAAIKQVVASRQLAMAMAANQTRSALASIVGPSIAGILYGLERSLPFVGDAIGNVIAAICAAFVRQDLRAQPKATSSKPVFMNEVAEGIHHLYAHPVLRPLVGVLALTTFSFWIVYAGVTLSLQRAGAAPQTLGLLQTAFGIGGLLGAILSGQVLKRVAVGKLGVMTLLSMTVTCGAMLITDSPTALIALMAITGLLFPAINVGILTFCMNITPNTLQGRMTSTLTMISLAMGPVGSTTAGFLLQHTGRSLTLSVGVLGLCLAAAGAFGSRNVRSIQKNTRFE
jgi:MFS family permease